MRKRSELPGSLRLGYLTYRIVEWPQSEARASGRYGETDVPHQIIRIQVEGRLQAAVAETLLHEIMHCIFFSWNICKDDSEERVVTAVGLGLATAMASNKAVFEWIAAQLHRDERNTK